MIKNSRNCVIKKTPGLSSAANEINANPNLWLPSCKTAFRDVALKPTSSYAFKRCSNNNASSAGVTWGWWIRVCLCGEVSLTGQSLLRGRGPTRDAAAHYPEECVSQCQFQAVCLVSTRSPEPDISPAPRRLLFSEMTHCLAAATKWLRSDTGTLTAITVPDKRPPPLRSLWVFKCHTGSEAPRFNKPKY